MPARPLTVGIASDADVAKHAAFLSFLEGSAES